jgi:hypothetical protein
LCELGRQPIVVSQPGWIVGFFFQNASKIELCFVFLEFRPAAGDLQRDQIVLAISTMTESKSSSEAAKTDFRTLKPNELEDWLDHVAGVFSGKGTPRHYFESHIKQDPSLDYAGIPIAVGKFRSVLCIMYISLKQTF